MEGRDRIRKSVLCRIDFRVDPDVDMDKEYTKINKISMCICHHSASLATQAVRTIGCNGLLAVVLSVADLVQNRSQICTVASASS